MINLDSYTSVVTALFVRLQIDEYRTTSGGPYTSEVLTFSDYDQDFTINGEVYQAVGKLLSVTASTSNLRPNSGTVSLELTGIGNDAIEEVLYSKIKGSPISIYRAFFDANTRAGVGPVIGRFRGFVQNYGLVEDYNVDARTATNTISLQCASSVDVLNNKFSGRKTNPQSFKKFNPSDKSMDRVPNLQNTTFNFGEPQ